jgi:hypothetical protein
LHINGLRISGHVDNLRIGRLNLNDRIGYDHDLLLNRFFDNNIRDHHDLLGRGFQIAERLRLGAQPLD